MSAEKTIAGIFGPRVNQKAYRQEADKVWFASGKPDLSAHKILNGEALVGIEVEAEQLGRLADWGYNFNGMWTIKEDRSLRNSGAEFVTLPIPLKYAAWHLDYLFNTILKKIYHFSQRTSIHFHFDVSSKTFEQVKGITLTYLPFEQLLYRFVGKNRKDNIFCMPVSQTPLVDYVASLTTDRVLHWKKYCGYNLLPLQNFGTIEFRHMGGTDDVPKLVTWMNLISSIINYGCSLPTSAIIQEITDLNTNSQYVNCLQKVFGPLAGTFDLSHVKQDMEVGVTSLKGSCLSRTFHNQIISTIANDSPMSRFFKRDLTPSAKTAPLTLDEAVAAYRISSGNTLRASAATVESSDRILSMPPHLHWFTSVYDEGGRVEAPDINLDEESN